MSAFRDIDIDELLPQQPPFRFVDTLEWYEAEKAVVSFTVRPDGLLMEDGCLSAAGLMEHMAQADAAREGYHCKYVLHIPVSIGFIGQVRGFTLNRLPKAGERLETTVYLRYEMFKVCLCDIEVYSGGELIASANMKTATKDD